MDSSRRYLYGEISLPRGRSISVLSEQYETSYLFYVTLSFLCNIIYYPISVFAFSLVTLSGATAVSYEDGGGQPLCLSLLYDFISFFILSVYHFFFLFSSLLLCLF